MNARDIIENAVYVKGNPFVAASSNVYLKLKDKDREMALDEFDRIVASTWVEPINSFVWIVQEDLPYWGVNIKEVFASKSDALRYAKKYNKACEVVQIKVKGKPDPVDTKKGTLYLRWIGENKIYVFCSILMLMAGYLMFLATKLIQW